MPCVDGRMGREGGRGGGGDRALAKGSACFFVFFVCVWDSPHVDGEGMGRFIITIITFKSETLPAPAPALEVRVRNLFLTHT